MQQKKHICPLSKKINFNYKSKEEKDYLITSSLIDNKIIISVVKINIPLISYKLSISLEEFYSLSINFKAFKSISEIYDNLKELIQENIQNLTIRKNTSSLELIISIPKFRNEHFSFILSQTENSKEEVIIEIWRLIKELKEENKLLQLS